MCGEFFTVAQKLSIMEDTSERRSVPVTPPVHVETFATHYTLTWQANGLSPFVTAVDDIEAIPTTATPLVDDTDTAGRERRALADIDGTTIKYVRVDTPDDWTLSWERRTSPTVSLSGTPTVELCRRVHNRTTDCSSWTDDNRRILQELTRGV